MRMFGNARDVVALSAVSLLVFASPAAAELSLPPDSYVRGDIGGAFGQNLTFEDTNPNAPNCDLCGDLFPSSTGSSVLIGGGVGYRFGPMFRADLTMDYLTPFNVKGHSTAASPSTGSAKLDALIGLANVYFDLAGAFPGGFGPFQPFVTAGIGVARDHLDTTTGTSALIGPFAIESHSRQNLAWAFGAGVGYPLTPELAIELAYKYLDTGQVRTGGTVVAGGQAFELTPSKTGDFVVHAVTVGVRYGF